MRGLKVLPIFFGAMVGIASVAGAAADPPTTTEPAPAAVSVAPQADVQSSGVGDAATVGATGTPSRGTALQVGPTLPAPLPGATGDQSIPDSLDLPANSGEGRRIVYSNSIMRIWVVDETGTVIKTHRVSGKTGVPYIGTYTVYSRSLSTFAEHNPTITWHYMVRFAHTPRGGQVGFHEIPTQCVSGSCHKMQTEDQLGQALSGGCVRQATEDAIWIWNWADVGTKVVVLP